MTRPINRSVILTAPFKSERANAAFERGVELYVDGVEEANLPNSGDKIEVKGIRAGYLAAEVSSIATKPVTEPVYKNGDEQEQEWMDRSEGR